LVSGALLVHRQTMGIHELTRFTMAWTWGKPSFSPLLYSLCLTTGLHANFILFWDSQVKSPEIFKIETPATLEAHKFLFRPLIKVRFEVNL
jgi:hypothetical protein